MPDKAKKPLTHTFLERAKTPVRIAVVKLHGKVYHEQDAPSSWFISYDTHHNAIAHAFAWKPGKAVVLDIDCSGGSPSEAYMLVREIRRQAEFHKKPVYAFIRRVAQSSGYWIASAADKIYALPVSDVGSIGVMLAGFGYHKKNKKNGIERRVFVSGDRKSELDEHLPLRKKDIEGLQRKLKMAHQQFIDHVRELRGGKIIGTDKKVMNGASWLAPEALDRGLIDGIGDMMDIMPVLMKRPVILCVFETEKKDIALSGIDQDKPEAGRKDKGLRLEM